MHRIGPAPVAAPCEAPALEDPHDISVDLPHRAALVARHVEVEGQAERVVGQRRAAGDEPRVVAPGVLTRMDPVGQPLLVELQRGMDMEYERNDILRETSRILVELLLVSQPSGGMLQVIALHPRFW